MAVGVDLLTGQRGLDARGVELMEVLLAVSQAVNDAARLLLFLWGEGKRNHANVKPLNCKACICVQSDGADV